MSASPSCMGIFAAELRFMCCIRRRGRNTLKCCGEGSAAWRHPRPRVLMDVREHSNSTESAGISVQTMTLTSAEHSLGVSTGTWCGVGSLNFKASLLYHTEHLPAFWCEDALGTDSIHVHVCVAASATACKAHGLHRRIFPSFFSFSFLLSYQIVSLWRAMC